METITNKNLILIVDDNSANVEMLVEVLMNAGFEIAVAIDGESAIEMAEYDPPDLILLDVQMPGIDGFETCQRLKANPKSQNSPVIFMTALAETEDKVKGLSMGAVDYITKPFQEEEVLARVRVHLKLSCLTKMFEEQNILLKQFAENLEQRVTDRTSELTHALHDLKQAQIQLVKTEKMSTLGQLVAGVAHEINNPVSFIAGNIRHAQEYTLDLIKLLNLYRKKFPEPGIEIEKEIKAIDLDYLISDLPTLITSMQEGTDRICNISTSLRTFSRSDTDSKFSCNIHEGIDSTILILRHRLKANEKRPAIEIIKEYGNLPLVNCYPGQLNQVFMNLLANAIDALEEGNIGQSYQEIAVCGNAIAIKTEVSADKTQVVIRIKDNGPGMSDEVKDRIFDHLFTTKAVGKGTGLGLSICRQIVEEKHGGDLRCISSLGKGVEFAIFLPI